MSTRNRGQHIWTPDDFTAHGMTADGVHQFFGSQCPHCGGWHQCDACGNYHCGCPVDRLCPLLPDDEVAAWLARNYPGR